MDYYNLKDEKISFFDASGKNHKIGTIKQVNDNYAKIDFTPEGHQLFGMIARKEFLDRDDLMVLLKVKNSDIKNHYGRDFSDINSILNYIQENANTGKTQMYIGENKSDITLREGSYVHNNNSIEKLFNDSIKGSSDLNKENIVIPSIQVFKDGSELKGKHIYIKAAVDSKDDYKTLMEYAALETLKENGVKVPNYKLKIINEKPYLITDSFDKVNDFKVEVSKNNNGANLKVKEKERFLSSKISYDMNDMASCFSKDKNQISGQLYEHSYLVAMKLSNSIYNTTNLDEDTKYFVDYEKNKAQSGIMKVLAFNMLIGNNDMHGGNIKVLLNKTNSTLTNKPEFEFAPFFDITPHTINNDIINPFLKNNKSLNEIEPRDLLKTHYTGLVRNEKFIEEFSYAKNMVKQYREKLDNIFQNKPEILNMIDNHFNKKTSPLMHNSLHEINYDASVLNTINNRKVKEIYSNKNKLN